MRRLLLALGLLGAAVAPAAAQSGEVVHYYHSDALGSVRAVTDAQGNVVRRHDYFPFGEEPGMASGADAVRFTGKERDAETQLDYFGARHYLPRTGRFLTVDPLLIRESALVSPQQWNRYAYVSNNPLRFVDPQGKTQESAQHRLDLLGDAYLRGELTYEQYADLITGARDGRLNLGTTMLVVTLGGVVAAEVPVASELANLGGAALAKLGAVIAERLGQQTARGVSFDPRRASHIFRDALGHVNPSTLASRGRYVDLFRSVASSGENLRGDAVQAGIVTAEAARAGAKAYTWMGRNGQQVWVIVRNGVIQNAGVNPPGAGR